MFLDNKIVSLESIIDKKIAKEIIEIIGSIIDIKLLGIGMTNNSYKLKTREKEYILRVPGEGTEKLINREEEYRVYQVLRGRGIGDRIVYISPKTGYKLTEYWDKARSCDPHNLNDVKLAMGALRRFHNSQLEVKHSFDLFENINYYERLWSGLPSRYSDYEETKEKIFSLKPIIDSFPKEWKLTHIDAVPSNILILEDDIRIIDWEYASMQDPHLDIAMFGMYLASDRGKIDQLIDIYFQGSPSFEIRIKIYAYIAVAALLWSNWAEYKKTQGINFDEYGLEKYQYAKTYYDIVKEEYINRQR